MFFVGGSHMHFVREMPTQQAAALSLLLVVSFKLSFSQQHRRPANSRQLAPGWLYTCETGNRRVCDFTFSSKRSWEKAGFTSSTTVTEVQQSQLLPRCQKTLPERFHWLEMFWSQKAEIMLMLMNMAITLAQKRWKPLQSGHDDSWTSALWKES